MWTQFMDMHSGGGTKEEPFEYIYIEALEKEANIIFYNRFGHSPERVTCTCCGEDYSKSEGKTLHQLTAYERGCNWNEKAGKYDDKDGITLQEYKKKKNVLIIPQEKIKKEERFGEVPEQGFVWKD